MRLFLCLFLSVLVKWSVGQNCVNKKYENGLEVIYNNIADYMPGWKLDALTEHDYNPSQCSIMSDQIAKEYSKYPASLRDELNLKLVWFSQFKFKNVDFWCTYNTRLKTVYLKSYSQNHFYTKQMFHHELSSIFLQEFAAEDFETKFKSNAPNGFIYFDEAGRGRNAIDTDQDSETFEASMNEKGFLNQYSMSHWENDFNEITQNLFLPKKGFWELYERYPRIKSKTDLVISLYESTNSKFNKSFFQSLAE